LSGQPAISPIGLVITHGHQCQVCQSILENEKEKPAQTTAVCIDLTASHIIIIFFTALPLPSSSFSYAPALFFLPLDAILDLELCNLPILAPKDQASLLLNPAGGRIDFGLTAHRQDTPSHAQHLVTL
jgi:hypothetical protein